MTAQQSNKLAVNIVLITFTLIGIAFMFVELTKYSDLNNNLEDAILPSIVFFIYLILVTIFVVRLETILEKEIDDKYKDTCYDIIEKKKAKNREELFNIHYQYMSCYYQHKYNLSEKRAKHKALISAVMNIDYLANEILNKKGK